MICCLVLSQRFHAVRSIIVDLCFHNVGKCHWILLKNIQTNCWIILENCLFQWKKFSLSLTFQPSRNYIFGHFYIKNLLWRKFKNKFNKKCVFWKEKKWKVGNLLDTWPDAVKRMSDNGYLPRFKNLTNSRMQSLSKHHTLDYWPCITFSPHINSCIRIFAE